MKVPGLSVLGNTIGAMRGRLSLSLRTSQVCRIVRNTLEPTAQPSVTRMPYDRFYSNEEAVVVSQKLEGGFAWPEVGPKMAGFFRAVGQLNFEIGGIYFPQSNLLVYGLFTHPNSAPNQRTMRDFLPAETPSFVFHNHPMSWPIPSSYDLRNVADPDKAANLIIGKNGILQHDPRSFISANPIFFEELLCHYAEIFEPAVGLSAEESALLKKHVFRLRDPGPEPTADVLALYRKAGIQIDYRPFNALAMPLPGR